MKTLTTVSSDELMSNRAEWHYTADENLQHNSGLVIECMPSNHTVRYSINPDSVEQLRTWERIEPIPLALAWCDAIALLHDAITIFETEVTGRIVS